jgi:hypothetical protein
MGVGSGFRVWVQGLRFRVEVAGCKVYGAGLVYLADLDLGPERTAWVFSF